MKSKINQKEKWRYYARFPRWAIQEFAYRFWMLEKRSDGPNMSREEYERWFQ